MSEHYLEGLFLLLSDIFDISDLEYLKTVESWPQSTVSSSYVVFFHLQKLVTASS